jgi:DNA modification methylase
MKVFTSTLSEKYFKTDQGVFFLGDAREVLKQIPSSSVDAVITDPPWGVGFDEYDDFKAFLDVRDELFRVMKQNSWLVFFFTPKKIYDVLPYLEKFTYRWMLVYLFTSMGSYSRNPLGSPQKYSVIMVFSKGKPKVVMKRDDVIFSDDLPVVEENPREPQLKPTFTVSELVTMFTRRGDLILDPFAGYGSIPLVCELFDRRWIGIEIDPVKYLIAKKIISEKRIFNIEKMKEELKKKLLSK